MRSWKILPPMVLLLLLAGCGKFFVKDGSGGGTTGSTGNYLYVGNASVSTIAGFSVGTTAISAVTNSPYDLGVAPSALAATPGGTYLYAASLAGAIYGYSIGSTGALTLLNSNNPVVSQISPVAIKVDPSGSYLIAVDLTPAAYLFSINATTGLLTSEGSVNLDAGTPNRIVFTPNNSLVYISLGTGGVDILTFSSTNGTLSKTNQILNPLKTVNADQGLAVDPGSQYLFVTETGLNGLRVFSIATSGALTEVTGSPYATALGPSGVLVDSTGAYVYVANRTASTISGFTLDSTTGALAAITGSPFTTGTNPVDLVEDVTDTHIAAVCSGGTPDLQLFTLASNTGVLTSFATATTGTDPTGASSVVAAK